MQLHELLEYAIANQKAVQYFYESKDGADGLRVGSPHALYAHPTTRNVSCDIHQHGGDSATDNAVPFKPFLLSRMSDVSIAEDEIFRQWGRYNGDAQRYVNAIAKISV